MCCRPGWRCGKQWKMHPKPLSMVIRVGMLAGLKGNFELRKSE
jgi:hypothetical protein